MPFGIAFDPVAAIVGAIGIGLTVLTYVMRSPIRLRRAAIATNVAMFSYGVLAHAVPTIVLHLVLLPLNAFRLVELQRFRRRIAEALEGEGVPEWSSFFQVRRTYRDGEVVFRRGDHASVLYYLESGTIELVDFDVRLHAGELFGEMAFFSEAQVRTSTAVAVGPVHVRTLNREELTELYARDSVFGLYLVHLITTRLVRDMEAVRASEP